jgi:hypothetical protein
VLRLHGTIPRTPDSWNITVYMFFYRDPKEVEKQQQEEAQAKATAAGKTKPQLSRNGLSLPCLLLEASILHLLRG